MSGQVGIAILAKAPVPGQTKTRLIPALGADGAAKLQAWLLQRTVSLALDSGLGPVTLWWDGALDHPALAACRVLGPIEIRLQPDCDLGERMLIAIVESTTPGGMLVIGTDCPAFTGAHLRTAAARLADHDAVLYPAEDGGYVLIGMRQAAPEAFADITWGLATVMAQTRQRLRSLNWTWSEPATLWDVDLPHDLERLLAAWPEAGEAIR